MFEPLNINMVAEDWTDAETASEIDYDNQPLNDEFNLSTNWDKVDFERHDESTINVIRHFYAEFDECFPENGSFEPALGRVYNIDEVNNVITVIRPIPTKLFKRMINQNCDAELADETMIMLFGKNYELELLNSLRNNWNKFVGIIVAIVFGNQNSLNAFKTN